MTYPCSTWPAHWIWKANHSAPNTWMMFRHAFPLPSAPVRACLKIACADKYWLWINHTLVIREGGLKSGPTRTDWYFDETDIAPFLRPGTNQIAVLAWYFGRDGASHRNSGRGGLLAQLQTDDRLIVSDMTWKVRLHPAFGQAGGGVSVTLAEQAVDFDARADIPGWTESSFDDSAWAVAAEIGTPPAAPWGVPWPRPVPRWRDDAPRPYENQSDLGLPVTGPAVVTGRLPANLQLYPRFRARAAAGGMEIAVHIERDKKTTRYLTRAGEQEFEVPAWGNGHDVTYTLPAGVELLEITYRETGYASEISGLFSSSDAALDRLWGKAARTARLCLRDTFMDCPDRERSPWIGDAANILEVTLRALDRRSDALIVKTLDELAGWAAPGGNLWSAVPTSRFAGGFREFPAQILPMLGFGLPTYLSHTDDRSFLPSFYPAMRRYLLELFQTGDGIVRHRGPWTVGWGPGVQCWYDWEENIDAELLDQLLYFAALGGLRQSALALGLAEDVLLCDELRRSQRKAFDAAYWSDALAAYRSPRHGDAPPDERAQALAILTGLAPDERHPQLADRIEESERCSIYMERYPLLALAHAGRPQSALRRLKRRFAAEIDSDYSTLPERFGERSNHAWGGAAIVLLAEKLAGVTLLESGFRKVRFAPPPDGLAAVDWTIPTLLGKLRLAFRREETGTRYQLSVPAGIVVELDAAACLDRIAVNGSRLDRDARGRCQGLRIIEQTGNPVRLLVGSGAWILFVEQG